MPVHSAFLKYFDEVCKSGSIRKAASKLHITSSAVNRQILKIEDELGVSLFERSHEGIKLTEAGHLLSQHISRTLNDIDRTMREINACRDIALDGLTLVGQESVISRFLPSVLTSLHTLFPGVSTSFMAASGRDLSGMVLGGSADIALIFDAIPEPGIEVVEQVVLPVGAVMAPTHPLANYKQLTLQECVDYTLILPDESWPLRDILNHELEYAKVDLGALTTSNSIEFLRAMFSESMVIGFQTVIGIEVAISDGKLVHIPLIGVGGSRLVQTFSIAVSENRYSSDIVDKALLLLQERLRNYDTNLEVGA